MYEIFIEGGYYAWTNNDWDVHKIELDFLEYEIGIVFDEMLEFYEFYSQNVTSQDKIVFDSEVFSFSTMMRKIIERFELDCSELNFIFILDPDVDLMVHEINFILFGYKRDLYLSLISEFVINKENLYTVTSMFSGCGGFDLGFRQAGFEIIWANDNDPYAYLSYRKNFEDTSFIRTNVQDLNEDRFPKYSQVLIGGFPCQGFSQAGPQEIDDSRNYLYLHFKRGLKIVKPLVFIAENVTGILTIGGGMVFKKILSDFEKAGYEISYKVLNAKDFGAPQERKRVFIVGTRNDAQLNFIFPESPHNKYLLPYKTLRESIWHLREQCGAYYKGDTKLSFLTNGYSREFMARQRKQQWDGTSNCIVACMWNNPLHPDGLLMKKVGFKEYVFSGEVNRTLSIKECLVIQSFPEDFELCGTIKAKYSLIGNAVPPVLAYYLAKSVRKCLNKMGNCKIR